MTTKVWSVLRRKYRGVKMEKVHYVAGGGPEVDMSFFLLLRGSHGKLDMVISRQMSH